MNLRDADGSLTRATGLFVRRRTMTNAVPERIASGQGPRDCRFCGTALKHTFVDLGMSPLCESYVSAEQLDDMEAFYPLHVYVCDECFLVQVPAHVSGEEIFGGEYAYFSSYSDSWLRHAERYTELVVDRFALNEGSQVVEIASNDGYLLKNFVARRIAALGIEPAANVAEAAVAKGVPTVVEFFGERLAARLRESGTRADLLIGNNVLAHVPALNDFVAGLRTLLSPGGVVTMEFPHLMCLIDQNQFDTICQEHYCYFSFLTVRRLFAAHNLTIFDVDELPTHGGSLRIYARHAEELSKPVSAAVTALEEREVVAGYTDLGIYRTFTERVAETKRRFLEFLIQAKREGKTIVGYGAPGKGNTLLNYCGVRADFIDYTVDRNPYKHGKFLPGTRIPIFPPEKIAETKPDYVLILPWNLRAEIVKQLAYAREWGARFVVPIPDVRVLP